MNEKPNPTMPILIVDDEPSAIKALEWSLRAQGMDNLQSCLDGAQALEVIDKQEIEVLLLDLNMPRINGREVLQKVTQDHPEVPVIIITAVDDVETAVQCVKEGAFDYLVKPGDQERLRLSVQRAVEMRDLRRQVGNLQRRLLAEGLQDPSLFTEIVTRDQSMMNVFRYVEAIAPTPCAVLITGETGTGKELIARALHRASGRSGDFVAVNVAGLDDALFSDAIFGHTKGAFTGAVQDRQGLVETAQGGTLFLDEIGDLSVPSQVKLLRLLQEHEYFAVGSDVPKRSEVRVVVATSLNLEQLETSGRFRRDLFYRISSHHVHLPPLRERCGDLPLLVHHFLDQTARLLRRERPDVAPSFLHLLERYAFPGNVRELQSLIQDSLSRHSVGPLSPKLLQGRLRKTDLREDGFDTTRPSLLFPGTLPTIKQAVDLLVTEAMARTKGSQRAAARLLGISQPALSMRLKKDRSKSDTQGA
jgi:DNA-binding NtrC family response regulator